MSCAPPLAEWPVAITGNNPTRPRAKAITVQPQDSTTRQTRATTNAISAVSAHALASSNASTRPKSTSTLSTSPTGRPVASAAMNGTISAAPTHHTAAAQLAVRTAA